MLNLRANRKEILLDEVVDTYTWRHWENHGKGEDFCVNERCVNSKERVETA